MIRISNYFLGAVSCCLGLLACNKAMQQTDAGSLLHEKPGKSNSGKIPPGQMLSISKTLNIGMPKVQLYQDTVYSAANTGSALFTPLPDGYDDQIVSFRLPKGYMVVFAENSDGTGESECYVAIDGAIGGNLPERLRNKISYIRYIPIDNPDKKGTAAVKADVAQTFAAQWYYNWGLGANSYPGQQYVPMTWSKWACNDANIRALVEKNNISHLLSFNEPDNKDQSNIPNIDTAVSRYMLMQKTGLRLGSPVTTQDQVKGDGRWLTRFMAKAKEENARIDFVAVHWYDWGNQFNNRPTDSLTAEAVFNRFKFYLGKVHEAYPDKKIWVTEFNANVNRTSTVVHEYFMKLSTEWMNSADYVERYSYFFPKPLPATNADGTLTEAGAYWQSLPSSKSFSGNIVSADTELF